MTSFKVMLLKIITLALMLLANTLSWAVLDGPQEFATQQYRDFLSREGSAAEISRWTQDLSSGQSTRAEMVAALFNSDEFQDSAAAIARLYRAYFNRIPDYPGLQYWIGRFQDGTPLNTISQAFASSPEFINTYGNLDNRGFATLVYQNVLGRNPDNGGLNFWVDQLQNGISRGAMMIGFSESPEYRTLSYNSILVIMMHIGMLQRSPEQSSFDSWINELDQGRSSLALIESLLGSTGYAARFGDDSNRAPVASSLSIETDLTVPFIQLKLIGADPDGDTLTFVLESPSVGPGYSEAYVTPQTGNLYVTLDGSGASFDLSYQVSDGLLYSQPAQVTIKVAATSTERGTGLDFVDAATYGQFPLANPYGDLYGAPGDAPTLPQSIDLSQNFPQPGDQGVQQSCVGFATAYAMKSYQERVEIGWELNRLDHTFSPAFVYNQIRLGDCYRVGSWIHDALNLIKNKGAATLNKMPYTDRDCTQQPNNSAFQEAANFKIGSWATLSTVDEIKAELANSRPVIIGMRTDRSMSQLRGTNSVYNPSSVPSGGGHAVTIVGYDNNRYGGAFKVINSWGTQFGDGGYFWLPYDSLRRGIIREAYSVLDAENTTNPEPVDPRPTPPSLPNLQITSWNADYDNRPGGDGTLEWRMENVGTTTAPSGSYVALMLSSNATISSTDTIVIYDQIPFDLEAGHVAYRDSNNSISFRFPDTLSQGTYYMAVWADYLNTVQESNENDNISVGSNRVDIVNQLPDLVIESWYAEWNNAGDGSFTYKVVNQGQSSADKGWDINLMLSPDQILGNDNDYYLFYEDIPFSIAAGSNVYRDESIAAHFNLKVSAFGNRVPAGTYYMAVWADDLDEIEEANERNNISWGRSTVTVSRFTYTGQSQETTEDSTGFRQFNGKVPPSAQVLMRKVEISVTPDGGRQLRMLDTEPYVGTQSESLMLKTTKSRDIGIFPVTKEMPMP